MIFAANSRFGSSGWPYRQLVVFGLLLFLAWGLASPVRAATPRYVAPTGNDVGDCSNSQAPCATLDYTFSQAQAGDTVNLAAGIYPETATLTRDLTLQGAGAGVTIIDGGEAGTVLTIAAGQTVILADLTVRHGLGVQGGGVYVASGANLTISDSEIWHNDASQAGGGIFNDGGTVLLNNSLVAGNRSGHGLDGGDSDPGGPGFGGGGLYNQDGLITLNGSTITTNFGGRGGSSFIEAGMGGPGGGIYNAGRLEITQGSLISGNASGDGGNGAQSGPGGPGGGLYLAADSATEITNSTISDNQTGNAGLGEPISGSGDGAGLYLAIGAQLAISASTFSDNRTGLGGFNGHPSGNGGAIFAAGTLDLINVTLSANQTGPGGLGQTNPGGDSGSGGGLYLADSVTARLTHLTVSDNQTGPGGSGPVGDGTSGLGGGLFAVDGVDLVLGNSIVAGNRQGADPLAAAADCGGGVTSQGFNLLGTITGCPAQGDDHLVDPEQVFSQVLDPLAQNEPGQTATHALKPDGPAVDWVTNPARCVVTIDQRGAPRPVGFGCDAGAYEASAWRAVCSVSRGVVQGIGMGDRDTLLNPQHLALAEPSTWRYGQVSGRLLNTPAVLVPEQVTFSQTTSETLHLTRPTHLAGYAYTFETPLLTTTTAITAEVIQPGSTDYLTPRALVSYEGEPSSDTWTTLGRTGADFVYRGLSLFSHSEVVTLPKPLDEATDLIVTAVVIDNDDDSRPVELEASAGGTTEGFIASGATAGLGLDLVELTLTAVPTGTTQVAVTLYSPENNGDSAALVGINLTYRCTPPESASPGPPDNAGSGGPPIEPPPVEPVDDNPAPNPVREAPWSLYLPLIRR